MFKKAAFNEDEVFAQMEKNLIANGSDEEFGVSRLEKAAEYLNSAAAIFEDVGLVKQAEHITQVLESLAALKLKKK